MATVNSYQHEHYDPAGLQPGASVTWWFGPWGWIKKGVSVTAQPFDLSTADRALDPGQAITELEVTESEFDVRGLRDRGRCA